MSVPYVREIFTKSLNPSLASHAPKVSITRVTAGRWDIDEDIFIGSMITNLRIIPSKHKSDIRKWVLLIRNAPSIYEYIINGAIIVDVISI